MRVAVLSVLVALSGCGRAAQEYPPQYQLNFMRACEAQHPVAGVCACTWAKIEAGVSRADFDALERLSAAERPAAPSQREIQGYALVCAAAAPAP
jgi:hypothetical protein